MSSSHTPTSYILTLSCRDRVGIAAAVSGHLAKIGGFILDSQQYADLEAERFFLRVEFKPAREAFPKTLEELCAGFAPIAQHGEMDWELLPSTHKPRLLIAVSKGSHCLNDLLHRWQTGNLPVDVVGVISNHPELRGLVEWHRIPFHHLQVEPENRAEQEEKLFSLFVENRADYLVLARYMQVLSQNLVERLAGRCINIHHSFLPSFKGARPYHWAHERGAKLIAQLRISSRATWMRGRSSSRTLNASITVRLSKTLSELGGTLTLGC